MHTHKETLEILNCSKMSLSRYVREGKIEKVKKGRKTFYNKYDVAALVHEVDKNKAKYKPNAPKREKKTIELPEEDKKAFEVYASADNLNKVGFQYLAEATEDLKRLGLYKDVDREILLQYALSAQNFYKYLYLSNENEGIFKAESGAITLHPHIKIMQHHQKMLLSFSDRLGLSPAAREKLEIKTEEKKTTIMDILND